MKKFFYLLLSIIFFSSLLFANELDEELIDKKFNQIKTSEFCSTNEWNETQRKEFVKAFILGRYWENKEAEKSGNALVKQPNYKGSQCTDEY